MAEGFDVPRDIEDMIRQAMRDFILDSKELGIDESTKRPMRQSVRRRGVQTMFRETIFMKGDIHISFNITVKQTDRRRYGD